MNLVYAIPCMNCLKIYLVKRHDIYFSLRALSDVEVEEHPRNLNLGATALKSVFRVHPNHFPQIIIPSPLFLNDCLNGFAYLSTSVMCHVYFSYSLEIV